MPDDLNPYTDGEVEMLRRDDEDSERSVHMLAVVIAYCIVVALIAAAGILLTYIGGVL